MQTLRIVAGVTGLRTLASTVRRTLSGIEPQEKIKMGWWDLLMTMKTQDQVILMQILFTYYILFKAIFSGHLDPKAQQR